MTVTTERRCVRCGEPLPQPSRSDRRYCTDACRMAAHQEREREARLQLLAEELPDEQPSQLDRLRAAVMNAVQEEKLLAVIAAEARTGNWRASAWLLSRLYPSRWGERGRDEPLAFDDDPTDPFAEFDELAERRRRGQRPEGY